MVAWSLTQFGSPSRLTSFEVIFTFDTVSLDLTEVISAFDTVSLDLTEVIFSLDTVSPLSHHLFKCAARRSLVAGRPIVSFVVPPRFSLFVEESRGLQSFAQPFG